MASSDSLSDVYLEINDIFDQLKEENERLNNELSFANKCLLRLKIYLIKIHEKYTLLIDEDDKQEFNEILVSNFRSLAQICPKNSRIESKPMKHPIKPGIRCTFRGCLKTFRTRDGLRYHLWVHKKKIAKNSSRTPIKAKIQTNDKRLRDIKSDYGSSEETVDTTIESRKRSEEQIEDQLRESPNKTLKSDELILNRSEREECFDPISNSYICPESGCGKGYATHKSLYLHLYNTHKELKYFCEFPDCKAKFRTTQHLELHMSVHFKRNSLNSELEGSDQSCSHEKSVDQHSEPTENEEHFSEITLSREERENCFDPNTNSYKCPKEGCDQSYSSNKNLYHHLNYAHREPKYFCDFLECNAVFRRAQHLKYHQDKHLGIKPYFCDFNGCDYRAMRKQCLDRHKEIHSKPTQTEEYYSELTLSKSEREKCFDPITNSYKCPKEGCDRSYSTEKKFYLHLYSTHRKAELSCEFPGCKAMFKSSHHQKKHMDIHLGIKPFVCDFEGCNHRSHNRTNLALHQSIHLNTKPFKCDFDNCNKSFKNAMYLRKHQSIHNTELTFKCTFEGCDQWFRTDGQRSAHRKTFHLKKPHRHNKHKCDWPGCDFIGISSSLAKHKLLHTGEKPYVCDWPECGKRFRLKTTLNDHKNIHNNIRPYVCQWPGCGYRCCNSGNLVKHMKLKHK